MTAVHFFIPVFFDGEAFAVLRENILRILPSAFSPHFHVLDDSAGLDSTLGRFSGMANVTVTPMPRNLGHQGALVHGLRDFFRASPPPCLVVTMDGDGEDRPEDIPALLSALEARGRPRPVVLARRTSREESATFKLLYFFYKRIFRVLTGTLIQTGNFALYESGLGARMLESAFFGYAYASTLVVVAPEIVYVGCPRGRRYLGQSKMGTLRLVSHGGRMLVPFLPRIAVRIFLFSAFGAALLYLNGVLSS